MENPFWWKISRDWMLRCNRTPLERRAALLVTSLATLTPWKKGAQTLLVNAAILDSGYCPVQLPWLVDIELPRAR